MSRVKWLGAAALCCAVYLLQRLAKRRRVERLKRQLNKDLSIDDQRQDLIKEQLSRNYAFLGQGQDTLRKSFVVVVGVGGVGSHAAHMLLRAGVERLRVIDFDQVTLSSLNRHAVATLADVGIPKTVCLEKHFKEICPHAKVEAITMLFSGSKAPELLQGNPDYVLDCIDHIPTKVELIKYCVDHSIPVISSMGAGAKADPSRICIADISDTQEDPLARATRRGLKKLGIFSRVDVVYSTEKPGSVQLVPLQQEKVENAHEYGALPTFRARILPVLGTIPALFGNAMATWVITKLANFPVEPLSIKSRERTWQKLLKDLKSDGESISLKDVGYVFEEVWRCRSAVSLKTDNLTLVKWDQNLALSTDNIICLSKQEAKRHLELVDYSKEYSAETLEYIYSRFSLEAQWSNFRY